MILWLVIGNADYYPAWGTEDWVLLTPDRDAAWDAYARCDSDAVTLVRIEENGDYVVESTR